MMLQRWLAGRVSSLLLSVMMLLIGLAAGWSLRGWQGADPQVVVVDEAPPRSAVVPDTAESGPWETFESRLAAGDAEEAIRLYGEVADPGHRPELAARMRERILDHGRLASGRRDMASALALLERYTFYYYRDVEAHYRLAEAAERLGRWQVALEA